MARLMIASLWSRDTHVHQTDNRYERLRRVRKAVEKAAQLTAERLHGKDLTGLTLQSPHGVFVAPEYVFAYRQAADGSLDYGDRRHIDQDVKEFIVRELIELSSKHRDLVILPGTIAWRKPLERRGKYRYEGKREPFGIKWVDKVMTKVGVVGRPKDPSRADKAKQQIREARDRTGGALAGDMSGHSPLRSTDKIAHLDAADLATHYVARNTAYLLYRGKVLLKYHKSSDYHEVLDGDTTTYIPGASSGVVNIEGLVYGVEICLDHDIGILDQNPDTVYGTPHLHLISSASVQRVDDHISVKNGGYLLHASSRLAWTQVRKKGVGPSARVDPFRTETVGGGKLRMYEITVG